MDTTDHVALIHACVALTLLLLMCYILIVQNEKLSPETI